MQIYAADKLEEEVNAVVLFHHLFIVTDQDSVFPSYIIRRDIHILFIRRRDIRISFTQ